MEITSKNNLLIKQLLKEKAKNRFLLFLDTPNLVKEGLNNNLEPKYILIETGKSFSFVSQKHYDKIIFVAKHVLQQLCEVKTSAGIIGVFTFEKKAYQKPKGDYLVLDNVQEAGNVGTLLRSALGADFKYVYLLNCAAVTNPKAIRASAGAIFKLNIFELSKEEFLKVFNEKNLYVADLEGKDLFKTNFMQPIGVALGNEGQGISKDILVLANNNKITLPMQNGLESLNVAVSGSIIMYEIKYRRG